MSPLRCIALFMIAVALPASTSCRKNEVPPASGSSPPTASSAAPDVSRKAESPGKTSPPPRLESIPAELTRDILYIEHDNDGLEMFRISESRCNLKEQDGAWEFTVGARAIEPLQRSKELAEVIKPEPNFEATAILKPDDLELKEGSTIVQKRGYDDVRGINLSNYYYFHHSSVEDVRIDLLEVTNEWILARVIGNSPEADAKLAVLTKFKRVSTFGRGIQ